MNRCGSSGAGDGGARPCHGGTARGKRRGAAGVGSAGGSSDGSFEDAARERAVVLWQRAAVGWLARAAAADPQAAAAAAAAEWTTRRLLAALRRIERGLARRLRDYRAMDPAEELPFCVRLWRTCALARLIVRPRGAARSARALGHLLLEIAADRAAEQIAEARGAARRSARFRGGGGGDAEGGIGPAIEAPSADVAADLADAGAHLHRRVIASLRRSGVRPPTPPERPPRDAGSSARPREMPLAGRAAVGPARRRRHRRPAGRSLSAAAEGSGAAELEGWLEKLPSWAAALRGWQMEGASWQLRRFSLHADRLEWVEKEGEKPRSLPLSHRTRVSLANDGETKLLHVMHAERELVLRAVSDGRRRSFSEITNGGAATTDEPQNANGGRRRSSAGGPSLGSWAAALERCILACSPNDGADYGGAQQLRS